MSGELSVGAKTPFDESRGIVRGGVWNSSQSVTTTTASAPVHAWYGVEQIRSRPGLAFDNPMLDSIRLSGTCGSYTDTKAPLAKRPRTKLMAAEFLVSDVFFLKANPRIAMDLSPTDPCMWEMIRSRARAFWYSFISTTDAQ